MEYHVKEKRPLRLSEEMRVEDEARRIVCALISEKAEDLLTAWSDLKPAEKWKVFTNLLPYVAPRLSAIKVSVSSKNAVQSLIEQVTGLTTPLPTK